MHGMGLLSTHFSIFLSKILFYFRIYYTSRPYTEMGDDWFLKYSICGSKMTLSIKRVNIFFDLDTNCTYSIFPWASGWKLIWVFGAELSGTIQIFSLEQGLNLSIWKPSLGFKNGYFDYSGLLEVFIVPRKAANSILRVLNTSSLVCGFYNFR